MKHAGAATIESLGPLLAELRKLPGLVERGPGRFYVKSKAFLHFHEDPAGTFADVKLDLAKWSRMRVSTRAEQRRLVALLAKR